MSLANGAVLDVAMGLYKGKGTGEHGLFRELKSLKCALSSVVRRKSEIF
jgi:hypothetical protein